jgi:hypothetical protein
MLRTDLPVDRGADLRTAARVLLVDAGGGAVTLRRLSWMEALQAKMAERDSARTASQKQ